MRKIAILFNASTPLSMRAGIQFIPSMNNYFIGRASVIHPRVQAIAKAGIQIFPKTLNSVRFFFNYLFVRLSENCKCIYKIKNLLLNYYVIPAKTRWRSGIHCFSKMDSPEGAGHTSTALSTSRFHGNYSFMLDRMRIIGIILLFVAVSGINSTLHSDPKKDFPDITASADKHTATVGDEITYTFSLKGGDIESAVVSLPEKKELYIEKKEKDISKEKDKDSNTPEDDPDKAIPVYIIHSAKKDVKKEDASLSIIMKLSFYRTGKHSLPVIEISDKSGNKVGYKIPEIEIKALNEKGEFSEIEPPLDLGGNYTRLIILIIAAIVLGIAGFILFKYIRKRMLDKKNEIVVIPPIEIFRKEMNEFNPGALIADGRYDDYVFGVSIIFRRFLSGLFNIDAEEMTTDELKEAVKPYLPGGILKKYERDIDDIMSLWDLSKFAEFRPSNEFLLTNLNNTKSLAENLNGDLENYGAGI